MKTSNRGIGLIEVMVSMAILAVVAIGLSLWSSSARQQSSNLSSTEACHERARTIAANIKSFDNDLLIRNWVPDRTRSEIPSALARDPICSDARSKNVCAKSPIVGATIGGVRDFFNFLNRRNAATWAYTVYNNSKSGVGGFANTNHPSRSGNCYVYIVDFDPLYLPTPVHRDTVFGNGPGQVNLVIEQRSQNGAPLDCTSAQVAPLNSAHFDVTVELNYRFNSDKGTELGRTCAVQTSLGYVPDNVKAGLRLDFRTRNDVPIPQVTASGDPNNAWNLCVDPVTSSPYPKARVDAGDPFGFKVLLTASEPGSYMRCSASIVGRTRPAMLKCTHARLDFTGSGSFDGEFDWLNSHQTYNARPEARLQYGIASPIPYSSASPQTFALAFDVTDVGRNQNRVPADVNSFFHLTMKPACPDRDSYCPLPFPPPNDGCGGDCPEGQSRGKKCPDVRLYCPHHTPCDECEKAETCPAGERGVGANLRVGRKDPGQYNGSVVSPNDYDCPPPDTYYPCEKRFTYCGAACPIGTKVPPKPNPNNYCVTTLLHDLCGNPVGNGTQTAPSPACAGSEPSTCPSTNSYCPSSTDIGATVMGTVFKDFNNGDCSSGSLAAGTDTGAEIIGCPPQQEYCQGAKQFIYDSCGRACPSGVPKAEMNWCCMGCNSLGSPPSFKKATSCDAYLELQGSGSCFFDTTTNCNQYRP